MPIREICRCAEVLDAAPLPCVTCKNRESCAVFLLHHRLQVAQVPSPTHKRSVISACSGYARAGDDARYTVDVTESLRRADVKHLCTGCPESGSRACEEDRTLDALQQMALMTFGMDIAFTMHTCKTKGRVLLPILQPGPG